jgi:hypothetical protein
VTDTDTRKVIFGPGRVRVSGSRVRGITPTPPPTVDAPSGGHGIGQGSGGGRGHGKGGGNSLAALVAALGAVSATGGKVIPSPPVGTTWFIGAGAPSASQGTLGDWYFNEANRDIYTKEPALATPAFGAAAWSSGGSATTQAFAMPAAITAGDLLVMVLTVVDAGAAVAPVVATPAGWTRIVNAAPFDFQPNGGRLYAFWRFAVGSDPAVTVTCSDSRLWHGSVTRYTGPNTTSPVNTILGANTALGTTLVTPAITTTVDSCLIVSYGAVVQNPTLPWGAPAGITVRAGDNVSAGRVNGQEFGDLTAGIAGAYGGYTWTGLNYAQVAWGGTFALAPVAGAATWTRVGALAA